MSVARKLRSYDYKRRGRGSDDFYLLRFGDIHMYICIRSNGKARRPRVEAGKNTSTVIPAGRKRRRKGNPVVSNETEMYDFESSITLTTDRLHYKLQTRPLVREGAPRRTANKFSGKRKEKIKSGHWPQRGARHQDILTD
jgi:hypothetical protein